MKRRITMSALLTLALAVVLGTSAFAQHGDRAGGGGPGLGRGDFPPPPGRPGDEFGPRGGPPGPPPGMRPPSPEELERAGVTASQRAKIEVLHDDAMRRMIRLGADVRIAELDLRKEVESDDPDAAAVEAAIERVGQLRTALHKAHVMEMLAVRAVLTPEQRAKLKKSRAPMGRH